MKADALPHGSGAYRVTFGLLVLAIVAYGLMQSLVVPALPALQRKLSTSVNSVSWVVTVYLLTASIAAPLIGRLGDMYGKKRLLVAVLAFLSLATLLCALAQSLWLLLAGRAIQGAASGIFPLSYGIIRDEFPRDRVPGAIGVISALAAAAGGVGLLIAGPIIDRFSVSGLFWLPLAAFAIAGTAVHFFVPESSIRVRTRVNWGSAALMSSGLGAVLLGVAKAASWHWLSAKTLTLLVIGALLLAAWGLHEARSSHPLVDMRMMRLRGVWTTNSIAFLLGFGLYSSFILLPNYVETPARAGYGFGASVTSAGLFLAPFSIAIFLTSTQAGLFERRFGSRLPMTFGMALTMASYVGLAAERTSPWEVYLAALLMGIGVGLAFAANVNLIIHSVDEHQTGVATGINAVARFAGGAFGGSIVGSLLGASVISGGYPSARAYSAAFSACAAALAVGVVISFLAAGRRGDTKQVARGPARRGRPGAGLERA